MSNDVILRVDMTHKITIPQDEYKTLVNLLGSSEAVLEVAKRQLLNNETDGTESIINHMTIYQKEGGLLID